MKRNTLLDFLTQRADPQSTKEFQRVFADAKNNPDMPSEGLQNLFQALFHTKDPKQIEKFYSSDKPMRDLLPKSSGQKFGEWLMSDKKGKSFFDAIKRQLRGKDPLDMSPADLDHLFGLYHDPTDTSGMCRALIKPESLKQDKSVDQIATEIAKFYNDNKAFFKSATAVSYDKKDMILTFEGPRSKLVELLETLGVQEREKEEILNQQQEMTGIWKIPLTQKKGSKGLDKFCLQQFWSQRFKDYTIFSQQLLKAAEVHWGVKEKDKLMIESLPSEGAEKQKEADKVMVFHGTLSDLAELLEDETMFGRELGQAAITNIKENRSFYKKG